MTTTSCSKLTLYLPVEESPNTHLTSHPISAISLLLPHTHTFDDAGKEGRKEGKKERYCKVFEMLNVVCSADVNIPQDASSMICDVHFGDTRYD